MSARIFSDIGLYLHSLSVWLVLLALSLLTAGVYGLEILAAGDSIGMWLLSLPLWLAFAYGWCEFALHVVERIAEGDRDFPVLSISLISVFSGPRRVLGVLLVTAAIWWLNRRFDLSWLEQGAPFLLGVLAVFFPAILIAVALGHRPAAWLNPVVLVRIALGLNLHYLALMLAAIATVALAVWWLLPLSLATPLLALPLVVLVHVWFFWLGEAVWERAEVLGYSPQRGKEGTPEWWQEQADRELRELRRQIHQLHSHKRINNGLPRLEQCIARYQQQGLDELDLWNGLWNELSTWSDMQFIAAAAGAYVNALLRHGRTQACWSLVTPLAQSGQYFPFRSEQDCLTLCERDGHADSELRIRLLTYCAKQSRDVALIPRVLLHLARLHFFENDNGVKAAKICRHIETTFPEFARSAQFIKFNNLLHTEQ